MATHDDTGNGVGQQRRRIWRRWLLVGLYIFFLSAGQTVGTLLGRLYFDRGGSSKWMATLVQSAGFPILFLAYLLFPTSSSSSVGERPAPLLLAGIYIVIGVLLGVDNLMYSYGLLYLPVSTYSLICATQLAFNAVLSRLINSQRFTHLILNSVVILTFSAALLGFRGGDASNPSSPSSFATGFFLTLGASAIYALILCLMQLSFQRVIKKENFSAVMEMSIYTSLVASVVSVVGMFASGEWRSLAGEAAAYEKGRLSYAMTLAWTAVAWQVTVGGVVGLVFLISSFFSNVISTAALPIIPVFAAAFFGDAMDGEKVIALLLAVWGFASYGYQHYLDDFTPKEKVNDGDEEMAAPPPPPSSL